jgi:hypothetical protein
VITEPTPVHDGTHGHWVRTSGTGDREGAGAGGGTSGTEVKAGAATPQPEAIAPAPAARLDLEPIRRWYGQAPAVTAEQRVTRSHVGRLLDEVDDLRAVETAAVVLLRAGGPGASWSEHEAAERVLCRLLKARGHEVGEATA